MAHLLLAVYLLTGLLGRGGIVLCEEADASLSLESWLQRCCAEEEEAHETLPHDEEAADSLCPAECGCVDRGADLLLTHRAEFARAPTVVPVGEPCPAAPAAVAGLDHRAIALGARPPRPDCRPELPGAGATPRVLRT